MNKMFVCFGMLIVVSFAVSAATVDLYEPVNVGLVSNAWSSSNFGAGYFQDLRNIFVSQQMFVQLHPSSQFFSTYGNFGFTLHGSCDPLTGDLLQVFSSQEVPSLNNTFAAPYAAGILRISPQESAMNLPALWTAQCVDTEIGAFIAPVPPGSVVQQTTPSTFAANVGRVIYVQQDPGPLNVHMYTPGSSSSPSVSSLRLIVLPQFGVVLNQGCPLNNQGACTSASVQLQQNQMYMAIACDVNNYCFYNSVIT